jgi:ATP-dependent RNA helicase HelY
MPHGDPRAPAFRHDLARSLSTFEPGPSGRSAGPRSSADEREARAALEAHPVHGCPVRADHAEWMARIDALEAETANLRKRVRSRTETLARTFERVLAVLEDFGYLREGSVTPKGERLARIYNESDLLVSEAIEDGVLDGLEPAELAAVLSCVVYETRIGVPEEAFKSSAAHQAYRALARLYRKVAAAEDQNRLELVREPDPGFAWQIQRWATGDPLNEVLKDGELTAGDFVRSAKQVWDLLRQIAELDTPGNLSDRCRDGARAIYRGVVAYSGAL